MEKKIETIRNLRCWLLEQVSDLSLEQHNQTPRGFNNNIAWNMGHLIAVQQAICYRKAGLPLGISHDFWGKFRSGSKPDGIITGDDIAQIEQLLLITLDQLGTDYNDHVFATYDPWSSRIGTEVTNIDDALNFLLFHDKLHSGIIIRLKRLLINKAIN